MSEICHSTLLKFLVNTSKMSEESGKIDPTIKSKVPGEQTLRGDFLQELQNENSQENGVAIKDFCQSPVITVTKEESTFTKGDLKLQKVIVSEDISDETANAKKKITIPDSAGTTEFQFEEHREVSSVTINTEDDTQTSTGDQKVVYKVTKIPILKFKQVVDKTKKEEETITVKDKATLGLQVTEAIPRLKSDNNLSPELSRPETQQDSPKVDDEFDRIYDEIFENGPPSGNFPSPGKIEDPAKLETKFEEIIHAYDEQKANSINAEKIKSKIPLYKRKSEHDIFAARQTLRQNSLKKRNSVDDTKCKLPVRLTREKQHVELDLPKNQKTVSTKNVTVFETVNTNISKSVTTTLQQKESVGNITQETKCSSISEGSKTKIPTHLKKIVAGEKASDTKPSKITTQLSVEKRSEGKLINVANKNKIHEPKTVVSEDTVKILNVKDNLSNIKTDSLIITDNVEKVPNTNDRFKKDITQNKAVEKSIDNRNQKPDAETNTHIVTKVDDKNFKQSHDSTQNEKLLDATNSINNFHATNKQSENNFAKTDVQTIHVIKTNSRVSINQEFKETERNITLQIPNSKTNSNQHDIQDKKSNNITENIPKDILNTSGRDVSLQTNSAPKNSLQEIKYGDSKNKLSDENIKSDSASNITDQIGSNIQNKVSVDVSRSNNEINGNYGSQEHIINKLVFESAQKTLNSSLKTSSEASTENNKGINSTTVATKQDKAVLISNQESDIRVQKQELAQQETKKLTTQEHIVKSENIVKTITTEVNNNDIKTGVFGDNNATKIINELVPESAQKKINSSLKTSTEAISTENNKGIINSTTIATKQDKAVLIPNQHSEIKVQKQELAEQETKKLTTQQHIVKSENIAKTITTKINNNDVKTEDFEDNNAINIINKLVSDSAQKSLNSSHKTSSEAISTENNKGMVNSTTVATKQDKAVLIPNQHSEIKAEKQELAEQETKKHTTQEHIVKSENIAKTITTKINKNELKTEVFEDNKAIKVIAITNNKIKDLESSGKDINELEEEDAIILKGKVNRMISRLDSKELKINKSEIDDLPIEESVVSKIALFEQSKPIDQTHKASITKDKQAAEIKLDKPKIVDEVLKVGNDSLYSDSKFSYNTFLNYKRTIKNSISVNENKVQTTSPDKLLTKFDKIYKTNIDLNKFNKTNENMVGRSEDEVFFNNEKANRAIINEYKINKELDLDMRRAKSLAELSYDGVQGRVKQMVVRMNSIDKMALERREQNEVRKKTRHGSVSERIALFEQDANEKRVHLMKKVTPIRMQSVTTTASSSKQEEFTPALNEEELAQRIIELEQALATYGHYDNMTYIELSDGGRLPTLVVGTALLDSQLVKPIIKAAIDLGYRAIDVAYIYGNEQAVGEAIREKIEDGTVRREELFVLSKLWSTNHRQDLVSRACQQSLDLMGLDYFDLYLIHNPMSFKEGPNPVPKIANVLQYSEHDYLEAWFGIESLIKQGLVKRGGVSNFNSVQVERVLDKGKIKPVINQVECHPYLSQTRLQDFLSARGVALSCFGCLGSSGTPRALRSALPPVIQDPLVRTMAAGLGVTPAQLLISYQVSLGRSVVVKASSAAHLWDNLRALDLQLAPAHAAGLAALNRNKRTFTFEGLGDTHKNYPFKILF